MPEVVCKVVLKSSQTVLALTVHANKYTQDAKGYYSKDCASFCHFMSYCLHSFNLFVQFCDFAIVTMVDIFEQHACIKFYVMLDRSATETLEMLLRT